MILDPDNLRKNSDILIDQVDLIDYMEASGEYTQEKSCVSGALAYYSTTGQIGKTLTDAVYSFVVGDFKIDEAKGKDEAFLEANGLNPRTDHQTCYSTVYQRPIYMEIRCFGGNMIKMKSRDYEDITCLMDPETFQKAKELVDDRHIITEDDFSNKGSFDLTDFYNDLQRARKIQQEEYYKEKSRKPYDEYVSVCEEVAKEQNGEDWMDSDDKDYMFNMKR